MYRTTLTAVIAILLLSSCGGDQPISLNSTQDPVGKLVTNPFELGFGETVTVENEGVSVTFVEVIQDSRCPSDVVCIWEGMVEIGLQVIDSQSDTFFVPVSMRPGSMGPIPPPKDTLGFRFALINVVPYPISTEIIPDSEYVATLAVFHLDPINPVDGEILMLNDPPPVADAFTFDAVRIEGDILYTTVTHGGGCGNHNYELHFSPPGFAESFPVQATLKLRHIDLDDPCDALITQPLAFDLRPLAQYYEMGYGRRDCMTLHVTDELAGRPEIHQVTVTYYPTRMHPSQPCSQTGD